MKRLLIMFTTLTIFSLFIVACYYDSEEALYPDYNTTCDTTIITFSGTIATMLGDNCYSCHSNQTASANGNNVRLENYADVVARNIAIAGSIKHTGSFALMPKNGGKISNCAINQFDIWVRKGMLNN
jgi:hypothetical protein